MIFRFLFSASLCLMFISSSLAQQQNAMKGNQAVLDLIRTKTIDQLLTLPGRNLIKPADVSKVGDALWAKFLGEIKSNPTRKKEDSSNRIQYDGFTMKYHVKVIGEKPKNGYPVYICMHGGGSGNGNDGQWNAMAVHYASSVKTGIYIAPRGIADTWNLHFMPASYPMYDRLIENMIAFKGADANRVYLLGFSAGGDGVYQITPRMADRWAAANMSSGHPNGCSVYNLFNTPFAIQLGEYDYLYDRNIVAADWGAKLDALQKQAGGGYKHATMIHRGGNHNKPWRDNNPAASKYTIYKDPTEWKGVWIRDSGKNWKQTPGNPRCKKPFPKAYSDPKGSSTTGVATKDVDSNAIRWVNAHTRNPNPTRLRWDYSTAAPSRNGIAKDKSRFFKSTERPNLFYWLDNMSSDSANDSTIDVKVDRATNTIHFLKCTKKVRLMLNDTLVDLSKPINIVYGTRSFQTVVSPNLRNMVKTLVSRGDRSFMYPAELVLERKGSSLTVVRQPDQYASFEPWSNPLKDTGNGVTSVEISKDGESMYAALRGVIVRLDPTTGKELARKDLRGKHEIRMDSDDTHLYAGMNGICYALDPVTLEVKWASSLKAGQGITSVHARPDTKSVFAACNGHVLRLWPQTGQRIGRNDLKGTGEHEVRMVSDSGSLYVGTNGYAYGLTLDNLEQKWKSSLKDTGENVTSMHVRGSSVYATCGGQLLRLSIDNGSERARNKLKGRGEHEIRMTSDSKYLYLGMNGSLMACGLSDTSVKWVTKFGGEGVSSVAACHGWIYAASDGRLYKYNQRGKKLETDELKGTGNHEVRIAHRPNAGLLVGSNGHAVRSFLEN